MITDYIGRYSGLCGEYAYGEDRLQIGTCLDIDFEILIVSAENGFA